MVEKGLAFERKISWVVYDCDQKAIVVVNRVEPWSLKNIHIEYALLLLFCPKKDKLLFQSKNTEQIICEIRNNAKVRNIKGMKEIHRTKGLSLNSTYHNNM